MSLQEAAEGSRFVFKAIVDIHSPEIKRTNPTPFLKIEGAMPDKTARLSRSRSLREMF
jgi:hypothetical protein